MAIRKKAAEPVAQEPRDPDASVPYAVKAAGAWAWRILLIAAVIALLIFLIIQLRYVVVPFLVAILVAALLVPFSEWLQRHRWPKWLAVTLSMVLTIGVIAGLVTLVVFQVRRELPAAQERTIAAYREFIAWLETSPLQISEADINGYLAGFWKSIQEGGLWNGALEVAGDTGHVLAGILLALFATLFILIDGRRVWRWILGLFPRRARPAVDGGGKAGWVTLTTFVKVQIFVAFVDAVGIGAGAAILGAVYGGFPLVIPIAVAVFLGSFVPVVGALLTGTLAVFVALVYLGPIPAVIMLGIVLLVQQVEGHVLQPLVLGTAVKVHPLAVVFAVAAGGFLAGIPGALFAVPFIATLNVVVKYIASSEWRTNPDPTAKELF